MAGIRERIKHAWSVFANYRDPEETYVGGGASSLYGGRPDRVRYTWSNERSMITSIYTRLAIDAASLELRHVRVDDENRYVDDVNSGLQNCLTLEANLDQGASAFRQDIFHTMFDKGIVAIVPVDTTVSPSETASFDIKTMRVGEITQWYPKHVKVRLYNENKGVREEVVVAKQYTAIVENPWYSVMNEPNSTLQRLIKKLNMLDNLDEQASNGKLDLIIQLPYVIKSDARREQAEQRRKDVEFQLKGSQYGIAYTDGTEKITQLNRPVENNMMAQIEYLVSLLYSQLGLTDEIMKGTADEKVMLNYINRTIEPILRAVTEAMRRTFLSKTARTQGQTVMYFRDPFKLVPVTELAEISDKFTRNEIATSNEMRTAIGWKPSKDPAADKLKNANMPAPATTEQAKPSPSGPEPQRPPSDGRSVSQNGSS